MKLNRITFFILGLLLVSSCEKNFDVNTGKTGNEMVINSLWNDASPVTVYITKPYPVGTSSFYITSIPDAHVELYEDSVFKEVLPYVPSDTQAAFGAYISNLIPVQGKNYTVKASEPKYLAANTTDVVPIQAQLITSALEEYVDSGHHPMTKMFMVFRDNPAVQNYYRINVWIYGQVRNISTTGDTTYPFDTYAMTPFPTGGLNDTVRDGDFLLFSDRGFNGQEKNLELTFGTVNRRSFINLTVDVELHTISTAHYNYFSTLNLYRNANTSNEPVYISGNVNDGLGAFVAEHIQYMTFRIK